MEAMEQAKSEGQSGLREFFQAELEQSRRELKEIALLLEQSQVEVNKLAQRNASISAHLQQVQSQFETLPRADIRMAYDAALEAQQRLFIMRGQVEKLQSDRDHLSRYIAALEKVLAFLESGGTESAAQGSTAQTLEMMIQAQEAERLRLSRQMHDGPAQALSNFILQTEIALRLFDLEPSKVREELDNLKVSATNAFRQVRDFIFELRPMMLDDLGLTPTLKRYLDTWKEHNGIEARLVVSGRERRLPSYVEVMIFRAIQELLNNVTRHSGANAVKVQLDLGGDLVRVTVDDNGKGFDSRELNEKSGMGLKVIRDRVAMLGGVTEVDSVKGQGTRVTFQIPLVASVNE